MGKTSPLKNAGNGGCWEGKGEEEAQCRTPVLHVDVAASQQQMKKLVITYKIWKVARGKLPRSHVGSVLLVSDANTDLNGIKTFFQ